ncbi:PLP-dependent transferase [Rhizobium sp. PP-F2F-G48]|uniref:PLP-dependent transferase n=1 Tax=Rhizobium sp. PP-F2F-G48 TaxID=2135651 RepID=UPI001FDF3C82|nr:PLP-dependent transferase [Rhizobium sp. PP-F2F-G48]
MRQTVGENSSSQEHLESGGFPCETGDSGRDKTGSDQGVGAHKDSGFVTLFLQDVIDGVETTSFQLPGTERADKLFALEAPGHRYTRVSNPTQDAFEQRLAEIEGGAAALALGSGQAASGLCGPQSRAPATTSSAPPDCRDVTGTGTWGLPTPIVVLIVRKDIVTFADVSRTGLCGSSRALSLIPRAISNPRRA